MESGLIAVVVTGGLAGPAAIHGWAAFLFRRRWVPEDNQVEDFDSGIHGFPETQREQIDRMAADVASLGLRIRADFYCPLGGGQSGGSRLVFLENKTVHELCIVGGDFTRRGTTELRQTYVQLISRFMDGSKVVTGNSPDLRPWWNSSTTSAERVPHESDPRRVVAIHRARLAQDYGAMVPIGPPEQDIRQFARNELKRLLRADGQSGYREYDGLERRFRLSWKGAWISALMTLPPGPQLVRLVLTRRGARLLRRLGLPPRTDVEPAVAATSGVDDASITQDRILGSSTASSSRFVGPA